MKNVKLLAALAIVSGVFIAGCLKDDYKEVVGVCPIVIATNPANLAVGVKVDQVITVTFNEPMNPATITPASFTLQGPTSSVVGAISYSGTTASFTFLDALAPSTTYTGRISTSVKDVRGNALQTDYVWTFRTLEVLSPLVIDLKSVARFGIVAGVGITSSGFSEIRNMDVGISPGIRASITGFPPAILLNGSIFASDDLVPQGVSAMLLLAKQDLADAYLLAKGASFPAPVTIAGDLGGRTLPPGIYKSTSTLLLQSGDLTLDAQGDANAVWIFQIESDFTSIGGAGGNVVLRDGAQAKNIFWQTGSSATLGNNTTFKGNILALSSITMNSGANAVGRMLARNGSVVLTSTNIIEKP